MKSASDCQDAAEKVVKPNFQAGEAAGKKDLRLQAVEVQELNQEDSRGKPILTKLVEGCCVLVQETDRRAPQVAIVEKILWNGSKGDVDIVVTKLQRAVKEGEQVDGIEQLRRVLYAEDRATVPARRVMHPCKVYFLPSQAEPMKMSSLDGMASERPRPGHLCWEYVDKKGRTPVPFNKLPITHPSFAKVATLIQRSVNQLRAAEEEEGLPTSKRTAPLPQRFKAAEDPVTPNSSSLQPGTATEAQPKSAGAVKASLKLVGAKAAAKPAQIGQQAGKPQAKAAGNATVKGSSAAAKGAVKADPASKLMSTAAAALLEVGRIVQESADAAVGPERKPAGKGAQAAAETKRAANSAEAEEAARNLAMVLELGGLSDSTLPNITRYVNVLLDSAGPSAEAVSNPDRVRILRKSKVALSAARSLVHIPQESAVERLAKAFVTSSQAVQAKLTDLGVHRVLGAWLCVLPETFLPATTVMLLRALLKAPFSEATLYWISRWGIFIHVIGLAKSPHALVQERAMALKVFWQDESENAEVTLPEERGAALQNEATTSNSAAEQQCASETTSQHQKQLPTSEGEEQAALNPNAKAVLEAKSAPKEVSRGTGEPRLSAEPPKRHKRAGPTEQHAVDKQGSRKRQVGSEDVMPQKKMKNLTEIHRLSPSGASPVPSFQEPSELGKSRLVEVYSKTSEQEKSRASSPHGRESAKETSPGDANDDQRKATAARQKSAGGPQGKGLARTQGQRSQTLMLKDEQTSDREELRPDPGVGSPGDLGLQKASGSSKQTALETAAIEAAAGETSWSNEQLSRLADHLTDADRQELEDLDRSHRDSPNYKEDVDALIAQKMEKYGLSFERPSAGGAVSSKQLPEEDIDSAEAEEALVSEPEKSLPRRYSAPKSEAQPLETEKYADARTRGKRQKSRDRAESEADQQEPKEATEEQPEQGTKKQLPKSQKTRVEREQAAVPPLPRTARKNAVSGGAGVSQPRRETRGKAVENRKAPIVVPVYAGTGKRRKSGTFDLQKKVVLLQDKKVLKPQDFCALAQRKGQWEETIMVLDDPQQRCLGEWMADKCTICDSPADEAMMLICSNPQCEKMYHIYCLDPPLKSLPPEDEEWFCPLCKF